MRRAERGLGTGWDFRILLEGRLRSIVVRIRAKKKARRGCGSEKEAVLGNFGARGVVLVL